MKENTTKENTTKENAMDENTTQENTTQENSIKENTTQENTSANTDNSVIVGKSVAANRLSVKETTSTELSADEEAYWEEMTKNRLKSEGIARRKDIGLIVMFVIMCIICAVLLYLYDQDLWVFSNPYNGS